MQITAKEQTGLEHRFHIVVPAADVASQVEVELQSIGKKAKMQGFRPGKVPMTVLKQRYGKEVMADVLDSLVNRGTRETLEQNKLRPSQQPDIKIVSFDEGQDLAFDLTVEVMPDVPDVAFENITVDEHIYELPVGEVEEGLSRLAKTRAHTHPKDGAAEKGDSVKINFVGKKDGVPFEGGTGNDFMLELGLRPIHSGIRGAAGGRQSGRQPYGFGQFPGGVSQQGTGRPARDVRCDGAGSPSPARAGYRR